MELDHLRIFDEAVRQGSFAGAAGVLELDPSAVSRAISGLEAEIGARLFERTTRRIALTEAGATYHARVAPLIGELNEAGAEARDLVETPTGRLRISASTAFGQIAILPMIEPFQAAHPEVEVGLILDDRPVDLVAERIDLAVRLSDEAPPGMVIRRLMQTRYMVVAAPDWVAAHPIAHPSELTRHDCLRFPLPGFRDLWRFRKGSDEIEVPVSGTLEVAGALALRQAAEDGMGPALLAHWTVSDPLAKGHLKRICADWEVTATRWDTGAFLLYPSRSYLPLKTRRFIEALSAHLNETGTPENL